MSFKHLYPIRPSSLFFKTAHIGVGFDSIAQIRCTYGYPSVLICFYSMTVCHKLQPSTNASVDRSCTICYGSVGKGLVHVNSGYTLEHRTNFMFPQLFPTQSPITLSFQHIAQSGCISFQAGTQHVSFLLRLIQTYVPPGVGQNSTACGDDNEVALSTRITKLTTAGHFPHDTFYARSVYCLSGNGPYFLTCKMFERETAMLPIHNKESQSQQE